MPRAELVRLARAALPLGRVALGLAVLAGAPAASARTLAAAELAAQLEPGVRAALAEHGLTLVALDLGALLWDVPEGTVAAGARLERPTSDVNLAALDLVVEMTAGEVVLAPRRLRVAARAEAEVWVASAALSAGEPLAGKVAHERRILAGPTQGWLRGDEPSIAGLRARRRLAAGAALRQSDIQQAPVVARGEQVQVTARSGALWLTSGGTALAGGRLGDRIAVRVFDGGRSVSATVVAPGVVAVGTPGEGHIPARGPR